MTTRRLRLPGPLPPRGRSGRFGLPPLAIGLLRGGRGPGGLLGCLATDVVGTGALERLVRRHTAEARAGQRRVRAALAVDEDRGAAAGQLFLAAATAEGHLCLGLGELRVG